MRRIYLKETPPKSLQKWIHKPASFHGEKILFFNKERTFIWEKVGRSLPKVQFVNAKPFRIGTSAHLRRHVVKPGGYPRTEMCQKVTISD